MNSENFIKRIWLGRKISIEQASFTKKEEPAEKSPDTKIRQEISSIIRKGILNGKNKLEILLELSSKPEYQKYKQYFKKWINAQYEKNYSYEAKGKVENEPERD